MIDDEYTDTLSVYDVSAFADAELGALLTSAPVTGAEITAAAPDRDLGARVPAGAAANAHDPFGAAAGSRGSDYAAQASSYAATPLYPPAGPSRSGPW